MREPRVWIVRMLSWQLSCSSSTTNLRVSESSRQCYDSGVVLPEDCGALNDILSLRRFFSFQALLSSLWPEPPCAHMALNLSIGGTDDSWTPYNDGGRIEITREKEAGGEFGWGNAVQEAPLAKEQTGVRLRIRVNSAQRSAIMALWLFEAEGEWRDVLVPIASLTRMPRCDGKKNILTVQRVQVL